MGSWDVQVTTVGSDGSSNFTLTDIPIGSYSVTASLTGYTSFTLSGVGVAAATSTSISIVLSSEPATTGGISGTIYDATGVGVVGAVVSVKGQAATATTTAADGTYTLTGVTPGFGYVYVEAPSGYLDSETRETTFVPAGVTIPGVDQSVVLPDRRRGLCGRRRLCHVSRRACRR